MIIDRDQLDEVLQILARKNKHGRPSLAAYLALEESERKQGRNLPSFDQLTRHYGCWSDMLDNFGFVSHPWPPLLLGGPRSRRSPLAGRSAMSTPSGSTFQSG